MRYEVRSWGKDQWAVERVVRSGARALIWIEPTQDYAEAVRMVLETEMHAWKREMAAEGNLGAYCHERITVKREWRGEA